MPAPSVTWELNTVRTLIVCNIVSLDGYFEGPGQDVMALPFDPAFDVYNAERLEAADTVLWGRTTFEQAKGYWPQVAESRSAPLAEQEIARRFAVVEKIVVSDSLTPDQTAPWRDTRILRRRDAHAEIGELKRRPGREIVVFGSRTLWNDLLAAGLVDELHLMIGPGVIGAGTPAFAPGTSVPLRLLDARPLADSQLALVRYGVRP